MPRIRTLKQAGRAVDRLGFCLLFPIKNLKLPNLLAESKGRPLRSHRLCSAWDEDTERVWAWKDELPRKRLAYYGKCFRGRGLFLSTEFLTCFYCLEENPSDPKDGGAYKRLYRAGRLTADARAVCEELFQNGAQGSMELRYGLGWGGKQGNQRFQRALAQLQSRLLITHFGAKAETRAWESVVYQLTVRAFPKPVRAAVKLAPEEARRRIAVRYRKNYPKATPLAVAKLFRWSRADAALGI